MKLLIGTPTNRDWSAKASKCLNALSRSLHQKNISFASVIHQHSCLSHSRQLLLDMAVKDHTHLLFIDDDSYYNTQVYDSLQSRDLDFVAANFVRKQDEIYPLAIGLDDRLISSKGKTGIEKISRIGLGFVLIKTNVLKKIQAPHFEVLWSKKSKTYVTEDFYFCEKLKNHGIDLYVDHDASQHTGHIGEKVFKE